MSTSPSCGPYKLLILKLLLSYSMFTVTVTISPLHKYDRHSPGQDDSLARLSCLTPFENHLWVSTAKPDKRWMCSRFESMVENQVSPQAEGAEKMTDRSISVEVTGGVAC